MRSFSDMFLLTIPLLLALVLLSFFAVPMRLWGWPLMPNVGLLLTLAMVTTTPNAWPRWFAFVLGLMQDVLFGTPLGSQALLMVLVIGIAERRRGAQPFRMRWLEAAGMILGWHILLWLLGHFVSPDFAPLLQVMQTAFATMLWYPAFYLIGKGFAAAS